MGRVISDVVTVQWCKPPQVMSKTADFLRRHGVEEKPMLLARRQSIPSSICMSWHVFACVMLYSGLLMTATL